MYHLGATLLILLMCLATVAPATEPATEPATAEAAPAARQAALKQRVTARWEALIHQDFATAYSFTTPEYRKIYSLRAFRGKFGNKVAWRRVEVINVKLKDDDSAAVKVRIHFEYFPPQATKAFEMKTEAQESWVRKDGQWWYLVQD